MALPCSQDAQHSERTSNPQSPCHTICLGKVNFGDSSSSLPHSYKAAAPRATMLRDKPLPSSPALGGFNSSLIKPYSQG